MASSETLRNGTRVSPTPSSRRSTTRIAPANTARAIRCITCTIGENQVSFRMYALNACSCIQRKNGCKDIF